MLNKYITLFVISFPCFFVSLAFNEHGKVSGIIFQIFKLLDYVLEFPSHLFLNSYSGVPFIMFGAFINWMFYIIIIEVIIVFIKSK